MKKSKKYFVFWEHCIREKAKMQWRHVCLMCVILLMLPFVGKAQQKVVSKNSFIDEVSLYLFVRVQFRIECSGSLAKPASKY